jgi:hypothetical protein
VQRDTDGNITAADRVAPSLWSFTSTGYPQIKDQVLNPKKYILVKGPHDGILSTGRRTLRAAINVEMAWIRTVKNPLPATLLKQVGDDQLEDTEIDALLSTWRNARSDPDGTVAYIPATIAVEAIGTVVSDVLVEARNAVAVDIARLIGLPASALDAGAVQTSMTYNNTQVGLGYVLVSQGITPYANCINAAFSQDNVVAPGIRTALDLSGLMADAANISRQGNPKD